MTARTALVPGGTHGIGRAVATTLAAAGWRVVVCHRGRTPAAPFDRTAGEVHTLVCDVTEGPQRDVLVRATLARVGSVDALVHAVGPFSRGPWESHGVDAWRAAFEGNVTPLVDLCDRLVPAMRARRFGRVVSFAMAGVEHLAPRPTVAPYSAAKAAVLAFTRALAQTCAGDGVTANCVSPGVIDTGGLDAALVARLVAQVPAGRAGTSDEAAAVVRFLLGDEAAYVNGANVPVAGAWGMGSR